MDNHRNKASRPITARAAENGIYLSLFMCVLLLLLGAGMQYPFCSVLFLIGAIAMPIFAYRLISRNCQRSEQLLSFAEIWAEGIASFFLGSLLPAALAYAALRFVFPEFLGEQVQEAIEVFRQVGTPEAEMMVATLSDIKAKGLTPTPADVAANLISINIIAGTTLSLFMAIVLSARMRMQRFSGGQNNQ